jgi:tetratricopeptide (TPR) repeat protein
MFSQKLEVTGAIILVSLFIFPHTGFASISTTESPNLTQTKITNQLANQSVAVEQEDVGDILSQTIQSVQSIDNAETKISILTNIAAAYAKVGQKEKASDILSQALRAIQVIQLDEKDFYTLNSNGYGFTKFSVWFQIVDVYRAIGKKEEASKILSQALLESQTISSPYTKVDVQVDLADQYIKSVEREKALQVLSQALQIINSYENSGTVLQIKATYLTSMAKKYTTLGQTKQSSEILFQALQLVQSFNEDSQKLEILDGIASQAIAAEQKFSDIKLTQAVLKVAEAIKTPQNKSRALTSIAKHYAMAGLKEKASQILSQSLVLTQAIERDWDKSIVLSDAATVYQEIGEKEKAFEVLFQGVERLGLRRELIEPLASICVATEQYDQVLNLVGTIKSQESAELLDVTVDKAAEAGQFQQALRLAQSTKDDEGKARALDIIVGHYTSLGQYEQALKIAEGIENDLYRSYTLVRIASRYATAGQYEQALKVTEAIKSAAAKAEILTTIASYYAVAGQKEKASQLLSQALQIAQAIEPDAKTSFDKASLFVEIAIGYAAVEQYEQAKNVAQTIQTLLPSDISSGLMALTLAGIAANYGANGQKEEAAKILPKALEFDKIASSQFRCPVKFVQPMLTEVATRYIAAGQYRQALNISEIFKENRFKKDLLNQIVSTYPENGQKVVRELKLAWTVSDCGL